MTLAGDGAVQVWGGPTGERLYAGATGERLGEAAEINGSLHVLGKARGEGRARSMYREEKRREESLVGRWAS